MDDRYDIRLTTDETAWRVYDRLHGVYLGQRFGTREEAEEAIDARVEAEAQMADAAHDDE